WHTYFHHAGLDTEDHLEASYNIMHKWYNIITGNLGYHTAHHMKQALHWSKLPEYHKSIEDKIPPHLFREPAIPVKWLPSH
ncbi:MAG: fatty acid desaturase, partial [Bdellovibrionales bacterium]|nr:fatty acid desaturase [Bdellovibrionales bacterium]